jgi:hypothetical protein
MASTPDHTPSGRTVLDFTARMGKPPRPFPLPLPCPDEEPRSPRGELVTLAERRAAPAPEAPALDEVMMTALRNEMFLFFYSNAQRPDVLRAMLEAGERVARHAALR